MLMCQGVDVLGLCFFADDLTCSFDLLSSLVCCSVDVHRFSRFELCF